MGHMRVSTSARESVLAHAGAVRPAVSIGFLPLACFRELLDDTPHLIRFAVVGAIVRWLQ